MDEGRKLIIMRGSGKSTLAAQILAEENYEGTIFSTDDYWLIPSDPGHPPTYAFDHSRLTDAHRWNQHRATSAMRARDARVIIIDNTNVQAWEARPYVEAALQFGYRVVVRQPDTPWWRDRDAEQMARRNAHNVSRDVIEKMLARWEERFDVEDILAAERP
ncbi:hypothetical protein HDU96_006491 [Phlyctochytrium bullatum]|nr:hypothetical protein HDU96_006491 [Phlyctochytrium bullatum]